MIVILIVGWRVGDVLHLSMRKAKEFIYPFKRQFNAICTCSNKSGGFNIYTHPPGLGLESIIDVIDFLFMIIRGLQNAWTRNYYQDEMAFQH